MNELIKVNYDNERITLSARELHQFLEVTERFSSWFERMNQYGFVENEDYLGCKVFNTLARQELQDYQITLDMAKEIAMIQRSDKGKLVRKYFLDIEKKWNSPEFVLKRALEISNKMNEKLLQENQELKPKAEYFDTLVERNLLTNFRDTAKEFNIKQNDFINFLLANKYVYRDQNKKIKPYAQYVESELFQLKEFKGKYNNHVDIQTLITPKGRETFRLLLMNDIKRIA